jgi:hypothetical protein
MTVAYQTQLMSSLETCKKLLRNIPMNVTKIIIYDHINRFKSMAQRIKIEKLFHDDTLVLVI